MWYENDQEPFDKDMLNFQDLHMVELEEFKYGGTNISAYRLVDPELEDVQNVVQDWVLGELRYGRKIPFQGKTIKVLLSNRV